MKKAYVLRFLRIFIILVVSGAIFAGLIILKPKAERQTRPDNGLLVEVMPAKAEDTRMMIEAYGTVKPREVLKLIAEVRGKIVHIDAGFEAGGFVNSGKTLVRIDPRVFRLEVERQEAQIRQIQAELKRLGQEVRNTQSSLKIATSDTALAKAEFFRLKKLSAKKVIAQTTVDQAEQRYLSSLERVQSLENQLALFGPAREQLLAQRDLLSVQLKQAKLDLEKTDIFGVFDGWVQNKAVEAGQYVNAGEYLGSVYRAGLFDVEVRLPVKDLIWLPENFARLPLTEADVFFDGQDRVHHWKGRLARSKAELDERTRTFPVIVEIDERFEAGETSKNLRMRPGMFVKVQIRGKALDGIFVLPRHMVHADDTVYLAENDRLRFREVRVLRRFKEAVFVNEGLADGEMIIKTPLSSATDGMKIRLAK